MWLSEFSADQRLTLLGLAYNVMVSDGLLDPGEEGMLAEFRREMDIPPEVEVDYRELDGVEGVFVDRRSRLIAMLNLLRVSYADGAFEIEEECLLKAVNERFELSDRDFLLLDNWVRRWIVLREDAEQLFDAAR
ncbi:MAG: hypothetical protein AAF918_08120 [Pseudomonadota bacterium]